jgi:hypothetical protein
MHSHSENITAPTQSAASVMNGVFIPFQHPAVFQATDYGRQLSIQCKLSIGALNDPLEDEADAMADKVMRMPEGHVLQRKHNTGNEFIQRQGEDDTEKKEDEKKTKLQQQPAEPNYLTLKTPFLERNVLHLWDPDAALGVWHYNYRFFKNLGVSDSLAGKAANLTAPFAIDSQLKADNPKWWEITDKDLGTTSYVGSVPAFSFDSNFRNWKFLPFLQKKSMENISAVQSASENFIQKKCGHCAQEEKINSKSWAASVTPFIQTKSAGAGIVADALANQINTSRGSGSTMDSSTRSFMEKRFGADFSNVNIHHNEEAVQMNRSLNAQAFTVGNDIYFNAGKYSPNDAGGKHLLAHELTHVVQQSGKNKSEQSSAENFSLTANLYVARFTDDAHHIIDEAGLAGGGFTEEQRKGIERGNKLRDYSQLPRIGNAILLCNPGKFGGYAQDDHFDNYIWDKDKNEWRDRSLAANQRAGIVDASVRGSDPIAHIKAKLSSFVHAGLTDAGLEDLGNAFHAVEDFFAHSNFIELINNDFRFGHELITGSVPGTASVSLLHTAEDVSTKESAAYYKAKGEEAKRNTDILSHANIAKDHLGDRNHLQARRLAALVVQDLSRDLLQIVKSPEADRIKLLASVVFTKIDRYLKFPDAANDAWWIKLSDTDNGVIDQLINKAQRETPATVNQCFLSPLRNLEASKDSNMKIILGGAIPVKLWGNHGFLQAGAGLITPLDLSNSTITSRTNDKPAWFVGAQLTFLLK